MVELRVLGEIRLKGDDGTEIHALLRQPKRLALLAYLASPAPGTWHRRDMVLALFWPDLDTSHARTSLRNGLYVIRQSLGDDVLQNRGDEEICIDPNRLRTDLAVVWDALKDGRPDEAIANYGGDLLTGLFPPDSDGFQRWLDGERTRLKVAVCSAAMSRILELEEEKSFSQALVIARRISEINPDDETIVRRLMTLHESLDDRAGGLAVFDSYRTRLAADFDADPAPATMELANRLRASTRSLESARRPKPDETFPSSAQADLPTPPERVPDRKYSRRWITSAVAAIVVVAALAAWRFSRPPRPDSSAMPASIGNSSPLTSDEGLQVEADISPNGRLVAYAKGNASRLRIFVQRIGGGAALPLTDDSSSVELMPRWSPDNDEILFLSQNNAYASPSVGGTPRLIARGTDGDGVIRSASWSPSGDSVVIVRHDSLLVQPMRGRGSRLVGRGFQLHSCVWAPHEKGWIACVSGNWIAFTPGPLFGNDGSSAVLLFPVGGGAPVNITGSEFQNSSPSWSADGQFLWFLSTQGGAGSEAYAARIGNDGRAEGAFIRAGLKAGSISLSASRFTYSLPTKKANLWAVPIPLDTTVTVSESNALTSANQVIELVNISRDGRWMIYDSDVTGNADIYRKPMSGGPAVNLTEDSRLEFAGELSPDNTELAWHRYVNGKRRLFVKRLDSDAADEIVSVHGDNGVPRWSPDGKSIAAWSHDDERGGVFVLKRDPRRNWVLAWRLNYGQLPIWTNDGRSVAFVTLDGRVQSIPADSGAVRTLYDPRPGDPLAIYLVPSRDPNTIWIIGQRTHDQAIWSLSLITGRPKLLVRLDNSISKTIGPGLAADSTRFYFPINERFSNIRWGELVPK